MSLKSYLHPPQDALPVNFSLLTLLLRSIYRLRNKGNSCNKRCSKIEKIIITDREWNVPRKLDLLWITFVEPILNVAIKLSSTAE